TKLKRSEKKHLLRKLLYHIIDRNLAQLYDKHETQQGGKIDKFVQIINKENEIVNYRHNNNRDVCVINKTKELCDNTKHCRWFNNSCYFGLTKMKAVEYVNKISEELLRDPMKRNEILKNNNYFVSDIVDYNSFTQKPGQTVIKSTNTTINKVLE